MIKKIQIDELKPGMYIHDLDCSWLRHPCIRNRMKVKSDKFIMKLIESGVHHVYIDTEKGLDVPSAPSREEVNAEIQNEIFQVAATDKKDAPGVSLSEEIPVAKRIIKETATAVRDIMTDVKFGRQIEREKVEKIVSKVLGSILRNQDALISLIKIRKIDEYTYMHSISTCALMLSLCNNLCCEPHLLKEIGVGALLHDIGKIMVPEDVLNKKGKLTENEFDKIKEHVEIGHNLLAKSGCYSNVILSTVSQHHERQDGTGYPKGMKGDEINRSGAALAIMDVYDALTSDRCYKKRIEPAEAVRMIFDCRNYHFNSQMVNHFIRCVGIYPVGTLVRLESGLIAVVLKQGKDNLLEPLVRVIYDAKKRRYLAKPHDIDLSQPPVNGKPDRIVTYESQSNCNIRPEPYML